MPVSTEDYVAISDHMGRYCWAVDDGDEEGWVALWTEDGVFTGVSPEPIVGRDALMLVPRDEKQQANGRMRHLIGNLHCDYQGGRDTVRARYYNLVTNFVDGGRFTCMAICEVVLVRSGQGWLIKRNDANVFPG
jgi:3-phenylpropionate/cinnamic acid dioxygenase small subunit